MSFLQKKLWSGGCETILVASHVTCSPLCFTLFLLKFDMSSFEDGLLNTICVFLFICQQVSILLPLFPFLSEAHLIAFYPSLRVINYSLDSSCVFLHFRELSIGGKKEMYRKWNQELSHEARQAIITLKI